MLVSVGDTVNVYDNETVKFCVILYTLQKQPQSVHILINTSDSGYALCEYTEYNYNYAGKHSELSRNIVYIIF